jgi:hypothetical protein
MGEKALTAVIQEAWKVTALAQLRDAQLHSAKAGIEAAVATAALCIPQSRVVRSRGESGCWNKEPTLDRTDQQHQDEIAPTGLRRSNGETRGSTESSP